MSDLRWWKLFAPSPATTKLALILATVFALCWLFLAYGRAELLERIVCGVIGGVAVAGYREWTRVRASA